MRKFFLAVGLLSFFALSTNAEQSNDERTMAVGISPIATIFGGADLLYLVKVTPYLAITVPATFYYTWALAKSAKLMATSFKADVTQSKAPISWSAGVGARFLMAAQGLNDSFYLEPRVSLGYRQLGFTHKNDKLETSSWNVTPMARLGWDWFFQSGFYTGIGGGLGMYFLFNNKTETPRDIKDNYFAKALFPTSKIGPAWDLEFKIGYSW